MKVRLPKSFTRLPPSEKEIINQTMTEEVIKQVAHEQAELQKIWLMFACIVLNRFFGFGRKRLLIFLANWRSIYRYNSKLKNKAEQTNWLESEMTRIFGKDGYPYEYIDKLEDAA